MVHGLLYSFAEQINIKVATSETVDIVISRFEHAELLPLLLGGELPALSLGQIVHVTVILFSDHS
jgi:hypothetical protein